MVYSISESLLLNVEFLVNILDSKTIIHRTIQALTMKCLMNNVTQTHGADCFISDLYGCGCIGNVAICKMMYQ